MADYVLSFVNGAVMGAIEGTAEGLINAPVKIKKGSKAKKRQAQYDKTTQKIKNRGLRPGEKRTPADIHLLYNSIPAEIRANEAVLDTFLKQRQFGHINPYSQTKDNSITNFIWQDKSSNCKLNNNIMSDDLKFLLKQQNKHFAATNGKSDDIFLELINDKLNQIKQKSKQTEIKPKPKTDLKISSPKINKASKIAVSKSSHAICNKVGNEVGKVGGKVIGKEITKLIGKEVAKKIGKKTLKAIPVVGFVVGSACAALKVLSNPCDPRNWLSAASDIGTSLIGPLGIVVDIGIQTICEIV